MSDETGKVGQTAPENASSKNNRTQSQDLLPPSYDELFPKQDLQHESKVELTSTALPTYEELQEAVKKDQIVKNLFNKIRPSKNKDHILDAIINPTEANKLFRDDLYAGLSVEDGKIAQDHNLLAVAAEQIKSAENLSNTLQVEPDDQVPEYDLEVKKTPRVSIFKRIINAISDAISTDPQKQWEKTKQKLSKNNNVSLSNLGNLHPSALPTDDTKEIERSGK